LDLKALVEKLDLKVICGEESLDNEVKGAYISDLLSDVMGTAEQGAVWVTLQVHLNIIAVATLKELSAILCVKGRVPDEETLEKARSQDVVILSSTMSTYEVAGRLWDLGIRP